jgi:hypothetical protein
MQKKDEEHIYEKRIKGRQACPNVAIVAKRTRCRKLWLIVEKKEEIIVDG